jgi:cysteinyl-tRNA synthetase
MSENTLGETFDIHGGGLDLIFPHHENEIAQSVCAHNGKGPEDFARYWLHNGMLTVGGTKMAKSEGNFVTARQALSQAPGEVVRLALLMTHYRDPLDWTEDRLREAKLALDRWYRALLEPFETDGRQGNQIAPEISQALQDDLNTPLAISRMFNLMSAIYRAKPAERDPLRNTMLASARLMGLLQRSPGEWLKGGPERFVAQIEERIAQRALARKERRFQDADRIRAELADERILLEDKPDGTTEWRSV